MYLLKGELGFLFSSMISVARKECLGESKRCLKLRAAISDPIGDYIAMSSVNSCDNGTYRIVSPFSI